MTTTRRYALLALGAAMAPALTIAAPLEQEYISKTGWCPSPFMPGPSIQQEHRQWHMMVFAPAVAGKEFVEFHREFIAQLDDFRLYGRDTAVGGDTGDPDPAIVSVQAQPGSQLKGPHLNLNGYLRPGPLDVTVDGVRSTPWVPRPANLRLGNAAFQAFTDNGVGATLDGLFHGNGHMTIATHDQMPGPWFGDMGNTLDATRDSAFFQWHKNIDNIYGDWAVGQYWPTPANPTRSPIYFSVIGAGVGRGGSSLNFRRQADLYLGNNPPVGIPTTQYGGRPRIASDVYVADRNRLNLLYHYGIRQWNDPPILANAWDVDAWTILNPAGNGWYFSVTPGSVGLAGTAVAAQAVRGGDVFESAGGGTNALFRTEDELGLLAAASDNLDALEVDQQRRVQATNDRARPGIADRTKQWFSLRSGTTFGLQALGPVAVGANDILQFNANGDLVRAVAAAVLGLGAAGNELDAMVIVDTAPLDTLNGTDRIYYSLAAGSPALAGNCPSDIFCHTVAGVACGALGGRLEMTAASLGLACTDDLDALDVRRNPTGLGACCRANGTCTEVTPANCTAAGDIFWGLETVCSAAECASDLGACCHADGTCTFVSDTACLAANGVFQGAGIACASVQCPSAPGNNDCDYGYEIPYDYPDQYQPSGYYEPPAEYTDNTYATTYDPLCDDPPYSCADHETFFPEYGSGSIWYYYDVPPTYPRGGPGEQLLYEQPVDPTDNGVGPGFLLAIGSSCPFNNTSAEDFTLTNSASITRVTWEGVYFGNAPDFPGMDVNFHITVYADNGVGNVGAVVANYPMNHMVAKALSTRPAVFGSNPVYAYSADLSPPLQATAGQRYWLSINGNPSGSAGPTWGWMVSQVGNAASLPGNDQPLQNVSTPCAGLPAPSYTPGGSDGTQDADLAFGLYGGAGGYDTRSIGFYTRNTYDSYEQGGDYAADTRLAIYYAPYGDCSYLQEVACGDNYYDSYNPPNPPYGGYGYVEYYNPPPGRYYIQVGTVGDANRGQIYLQVRDPGSAACCYPDGTCAVVDTRACEDGGGEPQAAGSSCMGDNNSNGIDDLCEDQPCADCGPGPHWIHAPAPCPAGVNHIPTTAVVGLDTNNDGVADTTLNLAGPTTVRHNVASDDSSNFPGTAPVDGHVDVIDYEMTYMNLTGGGATIIAGVGLGSIPLDASLGAMREQVGNPALADGFFDIFFEFDLGGGNRLYNHTPLRINAPNLDCFAPILLGLNPPGLVPLFTSPTGGSQVANLVTARHTTFPPPLEACCYPDGTCADNVDPAVCINSTPGSLKRFVIPLTGAQEVAPTVGDPDGTGTAYLTIDDSTSPPTISWNIVANNIEPTISGAHIHQGVAGTNGPVRVDFSAQLSGSGLQDPDLVSVLANPAGWYVNVHTQPSHAGGAIRGQMNAPVGGGEPQGPGSQCQGDADGNGLDDLCQDDPCDDCGPGPHWIHAPAPCPAGTNHIPTTAVVGLDTNNDGIADTNLNLAGPTTVQHNVASDDSSNFPGTAPVDGHVDVIDYEMTYMNLTGGGATVIAGAGLGSIPLPASRGAMREQVGNPALADGFFDVFFELDLGGGSKLYNHTPLRINAPNLDCFAPVLLGFNPSGLVPLFTSPTGGVQVANLVTARHTTFPTGIPGATVTTAVSRRSNPHAPGLCDTNLLPPRKSEPHQGGVQQVRIGFDVAPATPVGSGITLEQATCAAPAFVPYTSAAVASSSVASNELVVTFTPGLENGRSYRLNIGGTVTSISGQNVIVRSLVGDVNSDGFVNATDRSVVVGTWTAVGSFGCPTDVNSDGSTNATDRSLVVGAWTGGPATNCAP